MSSALPFLTDLYTHPDGSARYSDGWGVCYEPGAPVDPRKATRGINFTDDLKLAVSLLYLLLRRESEWN